MIVINSNMIITVESKKKGIANEEDQEVLQESLEENYAGNEFLIC